MSPVILSSSPSLPAESSPALDDAAGGPLLFGGIAAAALLVALVGWASTMKVASAALAPGRVIAEGQRKAVQHRDGGPVAAVLVAEGQRVAKGQPLLELDLSDAKAEVTVLSSMRMLLLVRLARLRAEAADAPALTLPEPLNGSTQDPQLQAILLQEEVLFSARRAAHLGAINVHREQIDGHRRQIEGLKGRHEATRLQLRSTEEEVEALRPLLARQNVPKPRVLALERSAAGLRGDLQAIAAAMALERSKISEGEFQIAKLEKERHESIAKDLSDAEARLAEIQPRLRSASDKLARAVLTAPEAGFVHGLSVFAPGAAVVPGQTVLEIVPSADALVLSVEISPRDIERTRPGQEVVVHLLPYKQRYQSIIRGKLEKISADRFDDKNRDRGYSYFQGIVRVDPSDLSRSGAELVPGMPVEAAIKTGERTVLDYFLDPIFRIYDFALREE